MPATSKIALWFLAVTAGAGVVVAAVAAVAVAGATAFLVRNGEMTVMAICTKDRMPRPMMTGIRKLLCSGLPTWTPAFTPNASPAPKLP